jgi:diadenosine tetraphosphate (Ap4A) HIT family hydrolase
MPETTCPLCGVWNREPQNVFYQDEEKVVIRTKYLKGHRERIQVVWKEHVREIPQEARDRALKVLEEIGKGVFSYTPKFVIMEGNLAKQSTVPDHWHLIASDLNPRAEDFEQILGTPWIRVAETEPP